MPLFSTFVLIRGAGTFLMKCQIEVVREEISALLTYF